MIRAKQSKKKKKKKRGEQNSETAILIPTKNTLLRELKLQKAT